MEQSLLKQTQLHDATQQLDARKSELDSQQFENEARQAGRDQQELAGDIRGMNTAQRGRPLRQFALESIENQVAQAGEQLMQSDSGESAQFKQRQAIALMQQLLDALRAQPEQPAENPQQDAAPSADRFASQPEPRAHVAGSAAITIPAATTP